MELWMTEKEKPINTQNQLEKKCWGPVKNKVYQDSKQTYVRTPPPTIPMCGRKPRSSWPSRRLRMSRPCKDKHRKSTIFLSAPQRKTAKQSHSQIIPRLEKKGEVTEKTSTTNWHCSYNLSLCFSNPEASRWLQTSTWCIPRIRKVSSYYINCDLHRLLASFLRFRWFLKTSVMDHPTCEMVSPQLLVDVASLNPRKLWLRLNAINQWV